MNSLVVCIDGWRPNFVFIPNTKCSQDFNETALEALSMPESLFHQNYKNNQDERRKDPKTMNRHTLPWSKSCKISVSPKIGI